MSQKLLFVDDDPGVLNAYRRSLHSEKPRWQVDFVTCPMEALERLRHIDFDAIVSDICMPRLGGMELLKSVKSDPHLNPIPFVVVTGSSNRTLKRKALDLGASDLMTKPVEREDLIARLRNALSMKQMQDELRSSNYELEREVKHRTAELAASRQEIIWRLAKAAEYRDEDTGNHVVRVGCYSRLIAKAIGMPDSFVDTIFLAAPLHDIGKIGIPDSILRKPGKLTASERTEMQTHCQVGYTILTERCRLLDFSHAFTSRQSLGNLSRHLENPVVDMAASIALNHHERWDGKGYPNRLAGELIPLEARIVAIADVYDALRSRRPYKEPLGHDQVVSIISEDAGSAFDPIIYEGFMDSLGEIIGLFETLNLDQQELAGVTT